MDSIVERIINLIKASGLNNKLFCERLNFNATAVTDWKNAKTKPSITQIVAMAELFNVTTDYILLGVSVGNQSIKHSFNNSPHSTITISNGTTHTFELSDYEKELFRIFQVLNIKNKSELLTTAYKLENEQKDNK